jgi:hypothetical protein
MAKIILQECTLPKLSSLRIAEASNPPNAPASEAEMMNRDTLKVNSLWRYHLDKKYTSDGIIPASKKPSMKRTAHRFEKLVTKALQMVRRPKPTVMMGMNHPGPISLQRTLQGISKTM